MAEERNGDGRENKRDGKPIREKQRKEIGKDEGREEEIILHAIFDASCSSSNIMKEISRAIMKMTAS
jgi:hypothetical protein